MRIRAHGLTDTGLHRRHNEDSLLLAPELGLFAVADGMGGALAGEVASRTALEVLQSDFVRTAAAGEALLCAIDRSRSPAANRLFSAILLANQVVWEAGRSNPAWHKMGTTIAAIHLHGRRLTIAHVGDSRCYLLRGGALLQMTEDHSLVAEQQRLGLLSDEAAHNSGCKNIITRALGIDRAVEIDIEELDLHDNDRLLLCSDGLSNMVDDEQLRAVLATEDDPASACRTLVDLANAQGGRDNISVITVNLVAAGLLRGLRQVFGRRR